MIGWPEGLCEALAARGLQVIRFDNRDTGHSTWCRDLPLPDIQAGLAGDVSSAAYRLEDMAADTVGLMDALGLPRAHLVGASLGGQIAQIVASDYPARVASLVSMMSTPGRVEMPAPSAMGIFSLPAPQTREQAMENAAATFRLIGSPAFPHDDTQVRERAGRAWDRGHHPEGMLRQSMAAIASGDRSGRLAAVRARTLVIHGLADPTCSPDAGRATAAAIPGAELVLIEGMGHNLPPLLWPRLVSLIAGHVRGTVLT